MGEHKSSGFDLLFEAASRMEQKGKRDSPPVEEQKKKSSKLEEFIELVLGSDIEQETVRTMTNEHEDAGENDENHDEEIDVTDEGLSFYEILGVSETASTEEIKRAFKKKALKHHPDKHVHASSSQKKKQEEKFKAVAQAYLILSDDLTRFEYDNDIEVIDVD